MLCGVSAYADRKERAGVFRVMGVAQATAILRQAITCHYGLHQLAALSKISKQAVSILVPFSTMVA